METTRKHLARSSAFSLVELLTVVATIAIVGAVAISFISKSSEKVSISKLDSDVKQLNSAVKVFRSNNGVIPEDITTAQDVITELKKAASNQRETVGLRGSMIDLRLQAIEDVNGEMRERAVWKPEDQKFVVEMSTTGASGFKMNDELAEVEYTAAARNTRLVYNDTDGWVWKTADFEYAAATGPDSLPIQGAPTLGATGGTGSANSARLGMPMISPGSDTYALASYPLQISIAKQPTDPQSAKVFYSIQTNTWVEYTGPFYVEPGTSVQAYTNHEDPLWEDSEPATATYLNEAAPLEIALSIPKNPINFAEAGGSMMAGDYTPVATVAPITVELTSDGAIPNSYENSENFRVFWTYDGSNPATSNSRQNGGEFSNGYSGDSIDYTLPNWDGASLLPVQIAAVSTNPTAVSSSAVMSANIGINLTELRSPTIIYNEEDTSRGDTVTIELATDFGDMPQGARIYYTTDGTDPGDDGEGNPVSGTLYTGSFDPLVGNDFSTDADIVARVYAPAAYREWFVVSPSTDSFYSVPDWEISGVASGWFSNPIGAGGMLTNIGGDGHSNNGHGNNYDGVDVSNQGQGDGGPTGAYDESGAYDDEMNHAGGTHANASSYFQWGDPGNWGVGANWLNFTGSDFTDVTSDERFGIGTLDYFNGTISMSSIATSVDFAVNLAFGGTNKQFDYQFDLLTTQNNGSAWQNADYVWFNDTESAQSISLYGQDYSLNLDFGETSAAGFSTIDQFHVLEGQSASASIYATLVSIGSWW